MAITDWSTNPSLNAVQPGIIWSEGMSPPQVNNSARQMMADIATFIKGVSTVFTPEAYGAVGDGVTNDNDAFTALATAVQAAGGGVIVFKSGATYLVGKHLTPYSNGFQPAHVLRFTALAKALVIMGNGAMLKCAAGLKYGTFNADGSVLTHGMPYFGTGASTPYHAMIDCISCSKLVHIENLELDGNIANRSIGGQYGDTGWQIGSDGIKFTNCTGPAMIVNVETHHHGRDGYQLQGTLTGEYSRNPIVCENVNAHHNMRQGCSLTGGVGTTFINCQFNYTGKSLAQFSAPGAGIDIEGESGIGVRNTTFINCEAMCNTGVGMISDQGNSRNTRLYGCYIVGDTNWALWTDNPGWRFYNCTIIGASTHFRYGTDPNDTTHFYDCEFRDDPAFSPTGLVYGGTNPSKPVFDLGGTGDQNILLSRCTIKLTHALCLPFTLGGIIFESCYLSQVSASTSFTRGRFLGLNVMTGANDFSFNPIIEGELIYNGVSQNRKTITVNIPATAAGAEYVYDSGVFYNLYYEDIAISVENRQSLLPYWSVRYLYNNAGDVRLVFKNESGGSATPGVVTVHLRRIPTFPQGV